MNASTDHYKLQLDNGFILNFIGSAKWVVGGMGEFNINLSLLNVTCHLLTTYEVLATNANCLAESLEHTKAFPRRVHVKQAAV